MRYIRTKDGRIIKSLTEIKEAYDKVPIYIYTVMNDGYKHCCNIQRDFVEKLADTIEELCDEFVLVAPYRFRKPRTGRELDKDFDEMRSFYKDKNDAIYGAIWTDKGLQFVALMNSEGVLELL